MNKNKDEWESRVTNKMVDSLKITDNNKKLSKELLDKYEETKNLNFLKRAIKYNYEILFEDNRIKNWIYEIRYIAARPFNNKETREARSLLDELKLLKPEFKGEMRYFFGSKFCLDSCLGIKIEPKSKWQLVTYDSEIFIQLITELKKSWKRYLNKKGISKLDLALKDDYVIEFCKSLDFIISEDEFDWGSLYDATKIALTLTGILNLKRFKKFTEDYPKDELNKLLKNYPYFSFETLLKLYKKAKLEVKEYSTRKSDYEIYIKNQPENKLVIKYEGIPHIMIKARPKTRKYVVNNPRIIK